MRCPNCKSSDTNVKDSRNLVDTRRRRRECTECGHRFTTTELEGIRKADKMTLIQPEVILRDKNMEPFDHDKLRLSIEHACNRRKISREDIEHVLESIYEKVYENEKYRVEVVEIIEWAISGLTDLDKLAAVRYAAQYLDFDSQEEFQEYYVQLCK